MPTEFPMTDTKYEITLDSEGEISSIGVRITDQYCYVTIPYSGRYFPSCAKHLFKVTNIPKNWIATESCNGPNS